MSEKAEICLQKLRYIQYKSHWLTQGSSTPQAGTRWHKSFITLSIITVQPGVSRDVACGGGKRGNRQRHNSFEVSLTPNALFCILVKLDLHIRYRLRFASGFNVQWTYVRTVTCKTDQAPLSPLSPWEPYFYSYQSEAEHSSATRGLSIA